MREGTIILLVIFLFLSFLTTIIGGTIYLSSLTCAWKWNQAYENKWEFGSGCLVKVNNKWFPENRVRAFED